MKFKKLLSSILILVAACALAVLSACGELNAATQTPGSGAGSGSGSVVTPDNPDEPEEQPFTVTLVDTQGQPFERTDGVQAVWRDDIAVSTQNFAAGSNTASITGLDGDYWVTLSNLPAGYAYDTNKYRVNNDNRDVEITIYSTTRWQTSSINNGSTFYASGRLTDEGVYYVDFSARLTERCYFRFAPKVSGMYYITSWVDATANEIDPNIEIYNTLGSCTQIVYSDSEGVEDGLSSNTYTSNFRYQWIVTDDMVTDETNNTATLNFAVQASNRNSATNFRVYFAVFNDNTYNPPTAEDVIIVVPQEQFKTPERIDLNNTVARLVYQTNSYDNGNGTSVEYRILDQRLVGLNPEDGYYHVLVNGQPEGAILYAYITSLSPIFAEAGGDGQNQSYAIVDVELPGNNSLTIYTKYDEANAGARKDYQLMLQGYNLAQSRGSGGDYDYTGYEDVEGYLGYVNNAGMYPVTQELKEFFQEYANSQMLFMDGDGWVESFVYDGYSYDAYEDSMWLFNCAYFVPKT